uniref:Uncharacterized protein n=1 Tax=Nelumbo nucifera TaxID=4432 RepID=A0A822ZGU7_NELNU|nr:TPA_asm: hypothetical protein HUJ06_002073 [Nelumbo nucifera]
MDFVFVCVLVGEAEWLMFTPIC